jgi:hypothetical protein
MPGAFDGLTAANIYGASASAPASAHLDTAPGIATIAGPAPSSTTPWYSPEHPLFVFGALILAAAGLVGFAGSARVGPARASGSLGKA